MSGNGEEEIEQTKPNIVDRIKQLREQKKNNSEIALILYDEKYATTEIMKQRLPLAALRTRKKAQESSVQDSLAGSTKGPGYLDEFKGMIRAQINRSRVLTETFSNIGLAVLLAGLSKSGISMDDFRKIVGSPDEMRVALEKAGETAFKALEYYQSDLITRVEKERDEARAYATILETQAEGLIKQLDPRIRFERMIQTYLFSGRCEPEPLLTLIDKWLAMESADLRTAVVA